MTLHAPPRVKICGLRDADNALAAARAGADFLGFVFVEGVRRQLSPARARAVLDEFRARLDATEGRAPKLAGLFRNQPADWVNNLIRDLRLDIAQLCGDEDREYARSIEAQVLRQVRVRKGETAARVAERVRAALDAGQMVVLDAFDPRTPGGAGATFDWRAARGVAELDRVLLAGGLTPENVGDAVRLLRPWGVDVSSGVETGGVKDPDRIRAFIAAARDAEALTG